MSIVRASEPWLDRFLCWSTMGVGERTGFIATDPNFKERGQDHMEFIATTNDVDVRTERAKVDP